PRWYVPRDDVVAEALTPADLQTFCPYKGIASYYDIDDARNAAWSYRAPFADMAAIGDLVSFEPDRVEVTLDDERLRLEPGQTVVSHGIDRNLSIGEAGALTAVLQGASQRTAAAESRSTPPSSSTIATRAAGRSRPRRSSLRPSDRARKVRPGTGATTTQNLTE